MSLSGYHIFTLIHSEVIIGMFLYSKGSPPRIDNP
nr:MAG TPA: hypothetical protein [Caudoviricetes sp.]